MLTTAILGLAVGLIMALTGAGGGILAVPFLTFGVGVTVAVAAPIGLLAVGMAAALGAVLGLKNRQVRYKAALLIAACGMVAAPAGLWLAQRLDNRWLSLLFAAVLLFVAVRTFLQANGRPVKEGKSPPCVRDAARGKFIWTSSCARVLALSGAVAGSLSGLLGVGGGFVMVPALQRYTDLAMPSIVATSLAVIALVSATGVASSIASGNLQWAIALPFTAAAVGGMLAGRIVAGKLAGPSLQKGFAAVSAIVALGMIATSLLERN